MGVYIKLDTKTEPDDLASITGWGDVGRYANGLPPKTADTLVHLYHYGWEQDLADLQKEVKAAMKAHPPKADVESTLDNLLSLIKGGGDDLHCVIVTNGMTADDGKSEDDEDG
jgi:hypothetical protein